MINEVSLILPIYNSEKFILKSVNEALKYFSSKDYEFEIILSVQKSEDKSLEIAKSLKQENVKVIYSKYVGKWKGIKNGIKVAKYKHLFFLDIDFSYPINFLDKARKFNEKIIIGSRYMKSSEVSNDTLRIIISKAYKLLVNFLFNLNVSDIQAGCKIVKKEIFNNIEIKNNQWIGDTELLYKSKKNDFPIKELAVDYNYEKNSLNIIKTSFVMFKDVLILRFKTLIE